MFEAEDFGLDEGLSGNDDIEELDGLLEELGLTGASLIRLLSTIKLFFLTRARGLREYLFREVDAMEFLKFFTFFRQI